MRTLKRIFLIGVLVLMSVIIALSMLELTLRLIRPELLTTANIQGRFWMYDPLLGWGNMPGARGILTGKDYKVTVAINDNGLRDKEYSFDKPAGWYRIAVLGNSFVWGYGVDQKSRFTDLLETYSDTLEVINLGCSGYSQDQELLLLQSAGLKYNPDLVIVNVHFETDVTGNVVSRLYGYNKPLFSMDDGKLSLTSSYVPGGTSGERFVRWMISHSALWNQLRWLGNATDNFDDSTAGLINIFTGEEFKVSRSGVPGAVMTCELLEEIRRTAAAHGAELLVMLTPNVPAGQTKIIPDERYAGLLLCLKEKDIDTLDLGPLFLQSFREHPDRPLTFSHDRHWNPDGHDLVSRALYNRLYDENF